MQTQDSLEPMPAWRRRTRGEHRWPTALAIAVAIALQLLLPASIVPVTRWLMPAVESALLLVLFLADPFRIDRESSLLRMLGLGILGVIGLSNGWSVVLLVQHILTGRTITPGRLLAAGAAIWLTNIIVFALAYWEFDRGGPAVRASGRRAVPDFLFAQMQSPELAEPDWEPEFADYLYLSFTNATAFSPTDVLPLSRWAKMIMMVQSAVALMVVVLVVARAVNVLH
ncbi:MAG: hypothetical protein JWO98_3560 [Frankiales bacterium]|nr:hypothetical protein [Frankiales bacterium]